MYGRSHYVDSALDGTEYHGVRIRLLPTIRVRNCVRVSRPALEEWLRRAGDLGEHDQAAETRLLYRLLAGPAARASGRKGRRA